MTIRDHMTIQLAATRYAHAGIKTGDALWRLGYTEARFAQVVGGLLERADVEVEYPREVRRLRRLRDGRRAARMSSRRVSA